jgi:hypothetical protein
MPARATSDTTPPNVAGITISPTTIDTSSGPATVSFTISITDDLSGVLGADLFLQTPTGRAYGSAGLNRESGTELDGTYEGSVTIPQYAEQGQWAIRGIQLYDQAGNTKWADTSSLQANGLPTTFMQVGADDTTPPNVAGINISPTAIDTSSGPATVSFTINITDNLSGVLGADLFVQAPSGTTYGSFSAGLIRESGSELVGTYTGWKLRR